MQKRFWYFFLILFFSAAGFTQTSVVYQPEGEIKVMKLDKSFVDYPTYEVYFQVPLPLPYQVLMDFEVFSENLVDYRFIRRNEENIFGVAVLKNTPGTDWDILNWRARILVREDRISLPLFLPFSMMENIPLDSKKWLINSDCIQIEDPEIQAAALQIKKNSDDVINFIVNMMLFTQRHEINVIPDPWLNDASSAFIQRYNNSIGRANLRCALLRAVGIPARSIRHFRYRTSVASGPLELEWDLEAYLPGLDWFRIGSSTNMTGLLKFPRSMYTPTMFICYPEDEFPVFTDNGTESVEHTSEPKYWVNRVSPFKRTLLMSTSKNTDYLREFFRTASLIQIEHQGSLKQKRYGFYFKQAKLLRKAAIEKFVNLNFSDCEPLLIESLQYFSKIPNPSEEVIIFEEDFEQGMSGWQSGGNDNTWAVASTPKVMYPGDSKLNVLSTFIRPPGEKQINNWAVSNPINLSGFSRATLSFWIWNDMKFYEDYINDDHVVVEVSRGGKNFYPLSGRMIGYNDNTVRYVGGWNKVYLDLTKYTGENIQLRFSFRSDRQRYPSRVFVDSIKVVGRRSCPGTEDRIDLKVGKEVSRTLLFERNYNRIFFYINNPDRYSHFKIWRREKKSYFQVIKNVSVESLNRQAFIYLDRLLKGENQYAYVVTGYSNETSQQIQGISDQIEIE